MIYYWLYWFNSNFSLPLLQMYYFSPDLLIVSIEFLDFLIVAIGFLRQFHIQFLVLSYITSDSVT